MFKKSKNQKTEKIRKLHMKFFLHFFRSRPALMSKYSSYYHYLAQPSRKLGKTYILISKMDPQKARVLYIVSLSTICDYLLYSSHSISELEGGRKQWPKITVASTKTGKYRVDGGDHFMSKRQQRPEKVTISKSEKTVKFQKLLMKFFFHSPPGRRPICQNDPQGCFT